MGKLIKIQPEDLIIREPSSEMVRVSELMMVTRTELDTLTDKLQEKKRVLEYAVAGKILDPSNRGEKISAGHAGRAVEELRKEILEKTLLLEGLQERLSDAEQMEKERLFLELKNQAVQCAQEILQKLRAQDDLTEKFNVLAKEIEDAMTESFWREDFQQLIGTALCRLPIGAQQRLEPNFKKERPHWSVGSAIAPVAGRSNFFLDRLEAFLSEPVEDQKS